MYGWLVAILIGQVAAEVDEGSTPRGGEATPASTPASTRAATALDEVRELLPINVPLPPAEMAPPLPGDSSAAATTLAVAPSTQQAAQARGLLAKTPGVHVAESGGLGQLQRLSVRGASSNAVAVLLEGMSWGRAGEGVDLALLPMALLESATLVRGAAAARFGPGAMAGALALGLSKQQEERLFVEFLGGSFGTAHGLAGGSGKVGPGHLNLWAQAMYSEGNFRYRFNESPNLPENSFVSLRRHNNDAHALNALLHYTLPLRRWQMETWTHTGFHKRGLAGPVENPSPSVRQYSETLRSLLRLQGPLGGGHGPFSLQLYAATQLGHMRLEGGSFGEGLRQKDNNSEFVTTLHWTQGPHLAFAQGSLRQEWLNSSEGGSAKRLGLGGMLGGEAWLWAERWALNGLVRADKAGGFAGPSAKLGSLWLLPWGFSLPANAGRSFRIPSFFELYMEQGQVRPNPELRPENAWSFDVGVAWEKEKARVAASYFWSRFEELILWEYLPPFALKPFNLGRAHTQGVEVEASWGPSPWLLLEAAYGWLHTQNLRADARYTHKPLPFRPRHQLFLRAEAGPRWLSTFVEWHFQSSQTRNSFGNLSWPARSLLNAGLKSQWLHHSRLQLGLTFRNLLNVHSQDMAGYPLPPRALFFSLSLNLDRAPKPSLALPPPSASSVSSSRFSQPTLALENL